MAKSSALLLMVAALLAAIMAPAWAGPPFLTDDPIPVDLHHWEFYLFGSGDRTRANNSVSWPAVEINNGILPNTQLHLIVPESYFSQNGVSARGIGDTEVGIKYRFIEQTKSRPDVGMFPLAEISTGSAAQGLGNGRTWLKVPLWLQKDWGPWETYGGGGYGWNPAPGMSDFWYSGMLLQRTLSPKLTLGGEIFWQGRQVSDPVAANVFSGTRSSSLWNLGGQYNFTPDFSLLFSAGHSFQGDGNAVFYLALYRTWGPGAP